MSIPRIVKAMEHIDDELVSGAANSTKAKKKSGWLKWGAMAACLCLVVAGILVPTMTHQTSGPSSNPHQSENTLIENPNPDNSSSVVDTTIKIPLNEVFINDFDYLMSAAPRYYAPELYDMVSWSEDEIYTYYGKNLSPAYIPNGLLHNIGQRIVVAKTGEVCADTVVLRYYHEFDETGTPKHTENIAANYGFSVTVSKLGLLSDCLYILPDDEVRQTTIGGTEVTFGYRAMPYASVTNEDNAYYDLYVAEFKIGEIAYQVVAEQMSVEDVIKVVSSIIYGTADIEITQ